MGRKLSVYLSVLLLSAVGILLSLNGCGKGSASFSTPPPPGKIEHVVIIFQENRTPDNLFQDPVLISRGADIVSSGMNSSNQTIPLSGIDLGTNGANPQNYDLQHSHAAFVSMYNGGLMNGADQIPCSPPANCPPNAQFKYVFPGDVGPYFAMAEQYTFGDHMFQTNQGPSFPAHQFIISGTSAPTPSSTSFVAENGMGVPNAGMDTGCTSPPAEFVWVIDPSGNESSKIFPCPDHPTLTDNLDTKGISWRYYAPSPGSLWTSPNAIQHMCVPQTVSGTLVCTGSAWTNGNVSIPQTNVLNDITHKQLPAVSWVIPDGAQSDHAESNDGSGPSWVASIVNAIGTSSYWSNTAIIITWDDWGGWYDHVPPPKVVSDGSWGSGYVYGFRVPLIVISPYAKAKYISKTNHDFGSILKFTEEKFNLPSLGYADANAFDDLSDCFDFTQTPLTFSTINSSRDAAYFLSRKGPPTPPDND